MTPTDLELRRMVAEALGWRQRDDYWITDKGIIENQPPFFEDVAWPCLLELVKEGWSFFHTPLWFYQIGRRVNQDTPINLIGTDPDPARAVILAWLKFKGGE